MKNNPFFIAAILFYLPGFVRAADVQQFNIQARSMGLGESALALENDFGASGNPAALAWQTANTPGAAEAGNSCTGMGLEISQARLAYDRYGYQVLAVVPLSGSALGIRFDQLIIQNQAYPRLLFNPDGTPIIDPITNQQAWQLNYDTRLESLFGLAYGAEVMPGISLGGEAQTIHLKVGEDYAWGFDGTVGMDAKLADFACLGLCLRQANGGWRTWRNPYQVQNGRPEAQAGVAWTLQPIRTLVTATLTQTLEWQNLPRGRLGVEYQGFELLTLRAGWDVDHVTLGAGFAWKAVSVDYAAIISGALYDANRLSLKIIF